VAKGYWIVHLDVTDQKRYDAYREVNGAAFRKYGARFLVRGGNYDVIHGNARSRNIVIEFPSLQAAKDCYVSPEYQHALNVRGNSIEIDMVVVEGYDGPQP
jgi:uncharacterized protein (DUF1330 family)